MCTTTYVYKITFKEVPHFYIGFRKHPDPKNDPYLGSPVTHKNYWEIYTPKKQIFWIFNSWEEAHRIEKLLISQNWHNKYCLNAACGGHFSLDSLKRGGKTSGKLTGKNNGKKNIIFAQNAFKEKYRSDSQFASKMQQKRIENLQKAFSERSKQKKLETFKANNHQQGSKNSMYGKMWITNGTKEGSYRINKTELIPEGFRKGRICK
jgi:hypothetical protein